jgi:beta-N-acetylhexosaminidase
VIFTDARATQECSDCRAAPLIAPDAIEEIILRLYGPNATGQVSPEQIRSFTFDDLARMLAAEPGNENDLEEAIAKARWIVFGQLDYNPEEYPGSAALRDFLAQRSDSLRDKRLVALSFSAPYYLDTTEISKLTAYFGVYSHTAPFLEMAVRALFREFSPTGAPPVSVSGINYDLIRQLEPAPGQIISLGPSAEITGSIKVGSQILLETGIIRDRNGNPVPDGTPVEFHLRYPTESLALAPKTETTVNGKAHTTVALTRPGELWITVQAGESKDSTRIELRVGGDSPGSIATVVPSPTPLPTVTLTPTPQPTATPPPTAAPTIAPPAAGPAAKPPRPRVAIVAFIFAMAGTILAGGSAFAVRQRRDVKEMPTSGTTVPALTAALWAAVVAWIAYLLYAVGWLPGATVLQAKDYAWAAGIVTFIAGSLTLFWTGRKQAGQ